MAQIGETVTASIGEKLVSNRFVAKLVAGAIAMALLTFGVITGDHWLGGRIKLGGHSESRETYLIEIGRDHLDLPANMIRFGTQRRSGPAERVDLYLLWPELEGYSAARSDRFNNLDKTRDLIFVQISQSVMSKDMSGRIGPIYSKFFDGAPSDAGNGLSLHRFLPEAGYGGDILLTASRPGIDDYAVRCRLPEAGTPSTSADCQRDFQTGRDLSVLYRFSSNLLPQWRQIDAAIENFVADRMIEKSGSAP